jgi:hypothetical protein
MLRFIDLTEEYWTHPDEAAPICAFLSTNDDKFLHNGYGEQTFDDEAEIIEHEQGERMLGLVPEGFFDTSYATQMPPQEEW